MLLLVSGSKHFLSLKSSSATAINAYIAVQAWDPEGLKCQKMYFSEFRYYLLWTKKKWFVWIHENYNIRRSNYWWSLPDWRSLHCSKKYCLIYLEILNKSNECQIQWDFCWIVDSKSQRNWLSIAHNLIEIIECVELNFLKRSEVTRYIKLNK